jgi:uncharacterized membrane protein (DUF2068 family)
VIIVERIAKAVLLIVLAIALIILGREGYLTRWGLDAQSELLLQPGSSFFERIVNQILAYIGNFHHITAVALGVIAYALLEGTEGVGLAMRRRWAEYLTVLATGLGIPFEVLEVIHRVTLLRAGALIFNVAIVVYLVRRKRLFMDV